MRGAMVGGVGYAAGRSAARRSAQEGEQEQRLAELESQQAAQPQAAPAAAGGLDPAAIEQLKQLAELRDSGVLTEEEFEAQKRKLLGG